jgi:recombination protein RecT
MTEKAMTPIDEITNSIQLREKKYKEILPRHIPAKRFTKTIILALNSNPVLASADRNSFYLACMKAAQDGLILDGREAALVTFRNKEGVNIVQYMPMTRGIIKKVRNSGMVSTLTAHVVYEHDDYKYVMGDDEKIIHNLPSVGTDRGNPIAVYAIAKLKDGSIEREWITRAQVEKVRAISRSGKDDKGAPKGIWKDWQDEMWEKTVLRRLMKRLPQSSDIDSVIQAIDADYDMETEPTTVDVKPTGIEDTAVAGAKETKAAKVIKGTAAVKIEGTVDASNEGDFPPAEPTDVI